MFLEKLLKRLFDFMLSLFGIILFAPLWLLILLAIILEDGLPVFFMQERVGKGMHIFKAIKFRSMIKGAEEKLGPVQAAENDPRTTKVGRILRATALDELPQLINILKGDMSFVGPRAIRPDEKEVHDKNSRSIFDFPGFKERSKVRPGLTGVAQIFAPRDVSRKNKFRYDIWYIRNQSFPLDIYLIIISFLITLREKWETRRIKFRFLTNTKNKIEKEIKTVSYERRKRYFR